MSFIDSYLNIDFYEDSIVLERALNHSNLEYGLLVLESEQKKDNSSIIKRAIETLKKFMQKCIDYLKSAVEKIKSLVKGKIEEQTVQSVFNNFNSMVDVAMANGKKEIKFFDMELITKILTEEVREYERISKDFSRQYIKKGAKPQSAEKAVEKITNTFEKYDKKFNDALKTKKTYSIKEAYKIKKQIEYNCSVGRGGYIDFVDMYQSSIDNACRQAVNIMDSLDQYSEDTGYIQNAKTFQQMMHNSVIRIKTHSTEAVNALLSIGVSLLCSIDKGKSRKYGSNDSSKRNNAKSRRSVRKEEIENLNDKSKQIYNPALSFR